MPSSVTGKDKAQRPSLATSGSRQSASIQSRRPWMTGVHAEVTSLRVIARGGVGVTIFAVCSCPHSGAGDESGLSFSTTYVTATFIDLSPVRAECGISGGI